MYEEMFKIKFNEVTGIQEFVKKGNTLLSDITIHSDNKYAVDGKSLMGIFSLDLSKTLRVDILEKKEGEKENFINFCKSLGIVEE
jgi:phosphotransferase system HPr-like phosphotransfer protein